MRFRNIHLSSWSFVRNCCFRITVVLATSKCTGSVIKQVVSIVVPAFPGAWFLFFWCSLFHELDLDGYINGKWTGVGGKEEEEEEEKEEAGREEQGKEGGNRVVEKAGKETQIYPFLFFFLLCHAISQFRNE